MVIKLDMDNVYDIVDWNLLIQILEMLGFDSYVTDNIWRILDNNWYSVLNNGQAHEFFLSTRIVKQGDPLSPTLSILIGRFYVYLLISCLKGLILSIMDYLSKVDN